MHLLLIALLLQTQATAPQAEIERVLRVEGLESFDTTVALPTVTAVIAIDLGADSLPAYAVAIRPAFRQTPTILIYRRMANGTLNRVSEGLAPGPLVPLTGTERDSHTLGMGMDFSPENNGRPVDTLALIHAALSTKLSIVAYHGFFHADKRNAAPFFIRLTDEQLPADTTLSCLDFQFSEVTGISFGTVRNHPGKYLVATTERELTVYHITGVSAQGVLTTQVFHRPPLESKESVFALPNGDLVMTRHGKNEPFQIDGP